MTLWRSAVAAAPASAKAHRALAEALYHADSTHANIDEVIAEADRSVALLDALPDALNTFQAFRQAGAYYVDKANATTSRGIGVRRRARLYLRALTLLDRAVAIARAGTARLPGASVEPEADAQRLRAAALLGLENPALALAAADRSRELQPLAPVGYQLSAAALAELSRGDDAAITLLLGSIVSGDRELGEKAMALYRSGLDADGCAVAGAGNTAALNPQCPIVRRHSCAASAAAARSSRGWRHQRAGQLRAAASRSGVPRSTDRRLARSAAGQTRVCRAPADEMERAEPAAAASSIRGPQTLEQPALRSGRHRHVKSIALARASTTPSHRHRLLRRARRLLPRRSGPHESRHEVIERLHDPHAGNAAASDIAIEPSDGGATPDHRHTAWGSCSPRATPGATKPAAAPCTALAGTVSRMTSTRTA